MAGSDTNYRTSDSMGWGRRQQSAGRGLRKTPAAVLGHDCAGGLHRELHVCAQVQQLFGAEDWKGLAEMESAAVATASALCSARLLDIAAQIFGMLGVSQRELCQYVKAVKFLERAKEMAEESGNRSVQGNACTQLGICRIHQGEYAEAISLITQAKTIATEMGNRLGEAGACNNLGTCYESLGRFEAAIDLYTQAAAIKKGLGDLGGLARAWNNIGDCYQHLRQYQRAVTCRMHLHYTSTSSYQYDSSTHTHAHTHAQARVGRE